MAYFRWCFQIKIEVVKSANNNDTCSLVLRYDVVPPISSAKLLNIPHTIKTILIISQILCHKANSNARENASNVVAIHLSYTSMEGCKCLINPNVKEGM